MPVNRISSTLQTGPSVLKRVNMRRFIEEILHQGTCTCVDLTQALGVTAPTSYGVLNELELLGLIEEVQSPIPLRGRPPRVFRLVTWSSFIIGCQIDASNISISSAGLDGRPHQINPVLIPTPDSYSQLLNQLADTVLELVQTSQRNCLGVGLAIPGLVNETEGRVVLSPNLHILDGKNICADLSQRTGLNVVCTQEEHALCLSEHRESDLRNVQNFVVMDFSTGVGMGMVSNGSYIAGARGFAGEIGHITVDPDGTRCGCGNRGCLETVASDQSLVRRLSAELGRPVDFEEIAQHLRSGDSTSAKPTKPVTTATSSAIAKAVNESLHYVAIGISNVINIFNPSAIFVHGAQFGLAETTFAELQNLVRNRSLAPSYEQTQILPARGTKLSGAMVGVIDHIFSTLGPRLNQ
jgi:predicted NBD/HSP70 family sugar kinase